MSGEESIVRIKVPAELIVRESTARVKEREARDSKAPKSKGKD